MILLGELSLWVALLMTIWSATVSFAGGHMRRADLVASGERAMYASFAFVALSSIGLWTALITSDFSLRFVASYTSANLPTVYKFSAFWGGQAGSMLFWCLILSLYSALTLFANRKRNRDLMPYVTGTLATILIFFLGTTAFSANPYARLDWIPPDGTGLNPQLQNPGMAFHPPNLYLGYVATSIPFAFAIAALVTRRLDAEWLAAVRRWSLVSWLFLTIGITMGMWWAYVELGWGGYWAWDPVENASLLPWLTGTAFLHSIMIQEKRGMLRKWNVTLVVATFLLSILGTFITRSGVIESVHSFAQSPVGTYFASFLIVAIIVTAFLVATRLRDLEARAELESMVSREAAFLYNNVVLVGIAFSVLWGTLFPIISEAVRGSKITVGPPFFNTVNIPLGLLLLALTGIGPLIAWRRASIANLKRQFAVPVAGGVFLGAALFALGMRDGYALVSYTLAGFVLTTITQEFVKGVNARRRMHDEPVPVAFVRLIARNRRRYGGYIVHFGVIVIMIGFAGSAFNQDIERELTPGQSMSIGPYTLTMRSNTQDDNANYSSEWAIVDVSKNGKPLTTMYPERRFFKASQQPQSMVALHTTLKEDLYLVYSGINQDTGNPIIKAHLNPLVLWIWIGVHIMIIGTIVALIPNMAAARVPVRSAARAAELVSGKPGQPVGVGS